MTLWPFLLASTLLISFDRVYSKEKDENANPKPMLPRAFSYAEHIAGHIEESQSTVRVAQDYSCVEYDDLKDTYWALKWADSFKEKGANLIGDWKILGTCDSGKANASTCYSGWNVQLESGVLTLLATEVPSSPSSHRHFTNALAATYHDLAFDRLQLRLALPLGAHLATSIVATDPSPLRERIPWPFDTRRFQGHTLSEILDADTEHLEIVNHTQNSRPLSHGLAFNETTILKGVHEGAAESGELSHFHTYDVQWGEDGVEFTLDGAISNIAHRRLRRVKRHLMFSIGVGAFSDPIPQESEALNWLCPALIIDSLRVFDRVSKELASGLKVCTFPKQTDDSVIEQICPKLKSLPNWRKTPTETTGNAQRIGMIVFLVALGCILPMAICILVKFTFLGNSRVKVKITYRRNEPFLQLVDVQEPNTDSVN